MAVAMLRMRFGVCCAGVLGWGASVLIALYTAHCSSLSGSYRSCRMTYLAQLCCTQYGQPVCLSVCQSVDCRCAPSCPFQQRGVLRCCPPSFLPRLPFSSPRPRLVRAICAVLVAAAAAPRQQQQSPSRRRIVRGAHLWPCTNLTCCPMIHTHLAQQATLILLCSTEEPSAGRANLQQLQCGALQYHQVRPSTRGGSSSSSSKTNRRQRDRQP